MNRTAVIVIIVCTFAAVFLIFRKERYRWSRRFAVRSGTLVFFVGLSFVLYTMGKASILLLDNKTVRMDGTAYEAFAAVRITVDGKEPIELYPGDRDQIEVTGFRHRISATAYDRGGREIAAKTASFSISGKNRMYLISVPAFTGGAEQWIGEFAVQTAPPPPEPAPPVEDTILPDPGTSGPVPLE